MLVLSTLHATKLQPKTVNDAIISAIHNVLYFSVHGLSLHSINNTYLCKIPTQQRQKYLPNLTKKNIYVNDTSDICF
jgi:hypothetical protein